MKTAATQKAVTDVYDIVNHSATHVGACTLRNVN